MPSIALSVILQSLTSNTRRLSAVCRKINGGSSNPVVGRCGSGLSQEAVLLGVGDGPRLTKEGKALSDRRGLLATLSVRSFL